LKDWAVFLDLESDLRARSEEKYDKCYGRVDAAALRGEGGGGDASLE
jgi:hypothetical protein